MKKLFLFFVLIATSFILMSWGWRGHYVINKKCTESFPASMSSLVSWADSLAWHGSDADDRKSWDDDESMRHYIDIDYYSEFNSNGHIASTFDSVVAIHGLNFVQYHGTIPWATCIMLDSLRMAFQQHDWRAAMLHASDLGHYVGDAHMPLHLTKNFDGQYTGNNGIHLRYESDMVYYFYNLFWNYTGDSVHFVTNPNMYVLNYIYSNRQYIDSIFTADNNAKVIAGNDSTFPYYQALWNGTHHFTLKLFHNASHSLAELIYTAWVLAGSPSVGLQDFETIHEQTFSVYPNPASTEACCSVNSKHAANTEIMIIDALGKRYSFKPVHLNEGNSSLILPVAALPQGIYYICLKSKDSMQMSRLLISR
jgi:hypothetical protein